MIRSFLLLVIVFFNTTAFSQHVVLIEKKAKNAALFDASAPYSLLSILKNNLGILGYYDLQGIEDVKVNELRTNNLHETIKRFVFPNSSNLPLIGFNGQDSVEIIDGAYFYVYPPPDTIYADLTDVTVITIELDNDEKTWSSMSRINLWKRYPGDTQLTKTFSSEAKDLLNFDAFKQVIKLEDSLTQKLTNLNDPKSMWSVMRDSAMLSMEGTSNESIEPYNDQQVILPSSDEFYWNSINLRLSPRVYNMGVLKGKQTFCEDQAPVKSMPFNLKDSARIEGTNDYELIRSQLNSCEMLVYQDPINVLDSDPDSPTFGEDLITIDENGIEHLVYAFHDIYYWVDYNDPIVYVTEDLVYNENANYTTSKVEQVYFCKQIGEGKPTLLSYFALTEELRHFFDDHRITFLTNEPWHNTLSEALKNRKMRYNLSKKCQLKKYNKRFQ